MIDVTLTIGSLDLSGLLSTYTVSLESEYQTQMTAIDGTEYGHVKHRPVISFSLIPLTDEQCVSLYSALSGNQLQVTYTNPYLYATPSGTDSETTASGSMRLITSLDAIFGLSSIDGNRYYKGGIITLRQRTVL